MKTGMTSAESKFYDALIIHEIYSKKLFEGEYDQ